MSSTEMKSYLSLIPISAKVRRRQNCMTILCIVLAVFLVTAVFSMADMEQFQEAKNRCFRILADYLHLLRVWRKEYAPHSPEEVFHPRFVEALQKQDHVEYLLDVLLFGETEEKAALITEYGKDVIQLEQRMAELAAADAARTKKHHERHAATPEH